MSAKDKDDETRVGYKSPPKHSRYQRGRSGNPSGRPKARPKSLGDLISRDLNRWHWITENGKKVKIRGFELIARQLTRKAMTPDLRAIELVNRLMAESSAPTPLAPTAADLAFVDEILEAARQAGAKVNEPSHQSSESDARP